MAFGSCIGAAGALVQASSITDPPGQYAAQINGAAAATGPFWQVDEVEARGELNALLIVGDGTGTELLSARQGSARNPALTDVGVFVTAEPDQSQHGLPANFGRGRGNWRQQDVQKVTVIVTLPTNAVQGAAGQTALVETFVQLVGSDIQIVVHNYGAQAMLSTSEVRIAYAAY